MTDHVIEFDIALSFASEQRKYVEQIARILKNQNIRVFYDKYFLVDSFGKNLSEYFQEIYAYKSKVCVIFISDAYSTKMWTNQERRFAIDRALKQGEEYILPVRFDDTELKGWPSSTGYIDIRDNITPERLAEILIQKLKSLYSEKFVDKFQYIHVIDPLKIKIINAVFNKEPNPLLYSLSNFGTVKDISDLQKEFAQLAQEVSERRHIYIDLTPFMRIVRISEIVNMLTEFTEIRPVILINQLLENLEFKRYIKMTPIVLVSFNQYGNKASIMGSQEYPSLQDQINNDFPDLKETRINQSNIINNSSNCHYSELFLFRRKVTEGRLSNLICQPEILFNATHNYQTYESLYFLNQFYKTIGKWDSLLDLSYELISCLFDYFPYNLNKLSDIENLIIILPSYSALFISSLIPIVSEIKIVADVLLPLNYSHLEKNFLYTRTFGKRVIIFQDVIATGSESDWVIHILRKMDIDISKLITFYDFGVGTVHLLGKNKIHSLCKPKAEIKKYISA